MAFSCSLFAENFIAYPVSRISDLVLGGFFVFKGFEECPGEDVTCSFVQIDRDVRDHNSG